MLLAPQSYVTERLPGVANEPFTENRRSFSHPIKKSGTTIGAAKKNLQRIRGRLCLTYFS
ncbi:MAG: hypothetical protein D6741_08380 [Planctomycetota bacterium]|nr:MAG: hypothetical protein D6741_08380 [Planctomycetota bacterium]